MLLIDQLAYRSKLRFESPMLKVFFAISLLGMAVSFHSLYFGISVFFLTGLLTVGAGGIPFGKYCKLLRIPLAFILLSVIAIVINVSTTETLGVSVKVFGIYISISAAGIMEAASISVTALGSVSCLYFLALNTPMTDILYVLKKLRFPDLLVELMLLTYRFIFILLNTSESLNTAQKSRLGNRNLKTSIRSVGSLMAVLFLRSFRKSSCLYESMESRCYDGEIRVLYQGKKANKKQIILVGCCIIGFLFWGIFIYKMGEHLG